MAKPARRAEPPEPAGERAAAIADLADRCGRRGHAIAFDLLRDPSEAEDAVQEALARAFSAHDRLRDPAAIDAWFYRILTRHCLKHLRRRRVARRITDLLPRRTPARLRPHEPHLAAALAELPAQQQIAVVLRHVHDCSTAEIAAHLGVKPSTVKTHLSRGLARLRALLGVDIGEPR